MRDVPPVFACSLVFFFFLSLSFFSITINHVYVRKGDHGFVSVCQCFGNTLQYIICLEIYARV